ncbi:MAG TPA: carboxypeptidase-like regulatory domain-containing protein, partial [Longimicrobiales bacterium]
MLKRIGAVVVFMLVSLVSAAPALAQQRSITGRVTSAATRDGIPGATVTIAGTTTGAITDENGNFTIANAPARDLMLLVRILGYRPAEVRVTQQQTSVMVPLQIDVLGLEELVVTGRATSVARRNLANAVGTVNAAELNRAPAESFERAIQGKVAGAIIEANSGAPGGGLQVRLRGVSTINAETQPLYVLDGVIISNAEIPSNQNAVTKAASGSNPSLNQDAVVNRVVDINPEDIESIEVLKGASAAAIYGSKASNGVVVITTRKGVTGRPRVHVSQRFGVFDLSNKLGFRQFETLEEATAAFGDRASQYWQAGRSFDHEELLAGRNDLSTETSASVSGGTEATRYFISGLWKNDEGVIENTGFAKQSVRLRLDQRLGSRASVGLGTTMLHTVAERGLTNNDNSGTSYWMVFPFTPNFVDLRESDNAIFPNNPFERSNPLQTAHLLDNEEDVWRVITSLNASFDLLQRGSHTLRIQSTTGIDYFSQKNGLLFPPELQFEPADDGLPGTSLLSNSDNVNVNVSGDLVHTMAPSDGGFSLTNSAGVQYEKRDLTIARVVSRNLVGGKSNIDAGTTVNVGQTNRLVKDVGFYAQSELITMSERLTVSGGLRAERTSANGDPDKYFFYPK